MAKRSISADTRALAALYDRVPLGDAVPIQAIAILVDDRVQLLTTDKNGQLVRIPVALEKSVHGVTH